MRIVKSMYVVAIAVATLTSCSSVKNMAVPTMDTAVSMAAKQGTVSDEQFKHWAHADLVTDTIPGMSLDKAYQFLEGKTGETVIVAVIDSGIDIEHEDLKDELWTNPKEIAGNNIDDDKNGYVDDVYGWNFLGGNGVAAPEQLEITRIVAKLNSRFEGKTAENISEEEKADFEKYQEYLEAYKAASKNHFNTMERLAQIEGVMNSVKEFIGKETLTIEDLKAIKTDDVAIQGQANGLIGMFSNGFDEKAFNDYYENQKENKNYDLNFDGRAIVGDNPEDITDVNYGNGFVIGSKDVESHGTHVAGIILASRKNGLGMRGVAHNAKLMSVRAVPDGDERDKDVALAIRYAVDNGAKVVNMSFGKSYSPHRHWVVDAIKYAEKHDVLLVHAAGNSSEDIDVSDNWPNDSFDKINEVADNVLTIGAMSVNYNEKLPASFTNYGQKNVDVFAPGVQIYSTVPKNEYAKFSGTSMASPEVAGIATLVRSYYPQLSASQVKHIIMNSGTKLDLEVLVPGKKDEKVNFSTLSISGKVANAYNALVLADKMVNGK
ncbi:MULTISPECIES: S8 family peptidase [Flavobacteriaceae]|uniref:Peptidase S8 n=2 Tax=Flavobacteriaceae TaxID=49546 RepID=A0A4Y8ASS8_9FLAO|nr:MULTISPECIES: S8 family peptidase [Flavobacteriaceae]TEW73722.1 peptidase S8 [Gramella jeungdoensis]GGK37028.1 peptidase S8 [Lutibacter litoralis]